MTLLPTRRCRPTLDLLRASLRAARDFQPHSMLKRRPQRTRIGQSSAVFLLTVWCASRTACRTPRITLERYISHSLLSFVALQTVLASDPALKDHEGHLRYRYEQFLRRYRDIEVRCGLVA